MWILFVCYRGKYATVCKAVHKKTQVPYAAKFVKKRRRSQDQMKEIVHEIAVLMQCSDTNRVIRLHEVIFIIRQGSKQLLISCENNIKGTNKEIKYLLSSK